MTEPLVTQLRFTRSELVRCLRGVSAADAQRRMEPMNSMSWIVGHLASQEQFLWLERAQGKILSPELYRLVGYGQPATTPPLDEMWQLWNEITKAADRYLETVTPEMLRTPLFWQDDQTSEDVGTSLLRNIYHYWFHIGEAHAIRQVLGHPDLPQFVGNLSGVRYA
ncbi:MAG: DinB family protein [Caldilineaceae bacterium]|nr:DinB family protein [Caldilineaceae bacterium]